jgi:hypothetical protein
VYLQQGRKGESRVIEMSRYQRVEEPNFFWFFRIFFSFSFEMGSYSDSFDSAAISSKVADCACACACVYILDGLRIYGCTFIRICDYT